MRPSQGWVAGSIPATRSSIDWLQMSLWGSFCLYSEFMIILITTLHKKQDAARIGKGLLEKRLIACYNLWPIESAYWWKGEIIEQNEVMMIMKSTIRWFDDIVEYVKTESGYEVPELIALDSEKIDPSYQKWINEEVR